MDWLLLAMGREGLITTIQIGLTEGGNKYND